MSAMEETQKAEKKKIKRTLDGTVVSTRTHKTAVVLVKQRVLHPVYKKYYLRGRRFKVHDPDEKCAAGDQVRIIQCRPISKEKRWMLQSILKKETAAA
jgi:small subunit ribosomal protein S17